MNSKSYSYHSSDVYPWRCHQGHCSCMVRRYLESPICEGKKTRAWWVLKSEKRWVLKNPSLRYTHTREKTHTYTPDVQSEEAIFFCRGQSCLGYVPSRPLSEVGKLLGNRIFLRDITCMYMTYMYMCGPCTCVYSDTCMLYMGEKIWDLTCIRTHVHYNFTVLYNICVHVHTGKGISNPKGSCNY